MDGCSLSPVRCAGSVQENCRWGEYPITPAPSYYHYDIMCGNENSMKTKGSKIPNDNLRRKAVFARPNKDQSLRHLGIVGDTYTILLAGDETDGRYCLIDMLV